MLKTNTYFDNNVVSIGFENQDGPATVGVMEPGEYEFGTTKTEYMTVISGSISARLPGEDHFMNYTPNQTFIVAPNSKFQVKITKQTAYLCLYK